MFLCNCGCGEEVSFNRDTKKPNRFIKGHQFRHPDVKKKLRNIQLGRKHSYLAKIKMSEAAKNRPSSRLGKRHSEESRLKMAKAKIGTHRSEKTKQKISKSNLGKKRTLQARQNMSIAAAKHVHIPRRGKNEDFILDHISTNGNIEIIRNSYEIGYSVGKFPDGYIPQLRLIVEVDEPFHYTSNGIRQCDIDRELILASSLGCMIYRIKEQDFLNDPERETNRFLKFKQNLEVAA